MMKAEIVRSMIIMRRYWFATVTGIIVAYGMFIVLIFGFLHGTVDISWAQKAIGGTFGLMIGMFAFSIVGMFSQGLQQMAQSGELEQVYMSPHGLIANFLARSLVGSVLSIVIWTILLVMVSATLKTNLHADPLPTALLLSLTYVDLIGFGFMVGGLVLVFKQTGQIAILVRLALMGIAFMVSDTMYQWPPMVKFPILQYLVHAVPVVDASICLKLVVVEGAGMGILLNPSFFSLVINCALWTLVGITCFKYMENWSRDKGTLGVY